LPARAPPLGRRRAAARCRAEPPTVAVTFVDGATGAELAQLDLPSGEQLRGQMLANKVDLYTAWNKVWSCGGAGQCGTCIVDVKSAPDGCLSDRSETEQKKLRGKPATWRLACQTFVGDEETPGQRVTIATKPK
jgi:ferredoxin